MSVMSIHGQAENQAEILAEGLQAQGYRNKEFEIIKTDRILLKKSQK